MSDVEGVTAEETTAVESVENTTPETAEKVVIPDNENEAEGSDTEETEGEQESQEVDWKQEAEKLKATNAEYELKITRQKAANKAEQERAQKAVEKTRELEQKLLSLEKPNINDFDDQAEFDKAVDDYNDKLVDSKAELKAQEIETQKAQAEQYRQAETNFTEKLEALKAEDPDVEQNLGTVSSYLDMLPQQDAGVQAFRKYLAMESDLGPQLANHLGKNPDIIEDQLIGKPWPIVLKKLQRIEQELSVPKTPAPKTKPLPEPIKKIKGSATPKNLHSGDVLKNLGLK